MELALANTCPVCSAAMPKKLVWGKNATEFDPNPVGASSGVTMSTGEGYSGTVICAKCKACGARLETDISIGVLEEADRGNVNFVWMVAGNPN